MLGSREEIAKLKQRIEEQDQIIKAFRNNDEVSGTNTMATEIFPNSR